MVGENEGAPVQRRAPASGRRQQQAEETRQQLFQAARQQFETIGYRATTVRSITRAADTAHGTFYLHFRNKEDACQQVITEVASELYAIPGDVADAEPHESAQVTIREFLGVFVEHRRLWRCLLEAMLENPALEEAWLDFRRTFLHQGEMILRSLQAKGMVREFDPELAAQALGSMVEWLAFTYFVASESDPDPDPDPKEIDRVAAVLTDLYRHAVFGTLPN